MIWPPKVSVARDPQTCAAGVAARLADVGRPEIVQVDAVVPSVAHGHGWVPAVGSQLVAAAGFNGGILPSADAACSSAGRACGVARCCSSR